MTTKFNVTASAFDRQTGKYIAGPRTEEIDTANNELFVDCDTIVQVKNAYEEFWNNVNPRSTEVVFVSEVTPIN